MACELFWIILSKLDLENFDDRTDIWTVAGSCKTLKQQLEQFRAKLRSRGPWNLMQISDQHHGLRTTAFLITAYLPKLVFLKTCILCPIL